MFLLGAIEYLNTIDSIFSLEEAIAVYFGKGTLNLFRQNHGYKENTYVKIWTDTDGTKVEDNVIMMGLLTGISMFPGIDVASSNTIEKFQAELYSELEDYYTAMLESTVSADKEA